MKMYATAVAALGVAALIGYSAHSFQPAAPSKERMIEVLKERAAPAPEHKVLEGMVGDFSTAGSVTIMAGLDLTWKGTEKARMILGGRFLEIDYLSDAGEKLEISGKTILGFDTRSKKYTIWAIDTTGTYSVSGSGDFDAAKKELTLSGKSSEQGVAAKFKYVFKLGDPAARSMEVFYAIPGAAAGEEWVKQVDVTCVKK